ncbi:hypothetical protein [Bosea sp. OK403]|jgi:hypothetical protein|nr:hypothetical protein [Bosea sp. OK403]
MMPAEDRFPLFGIMLYDGAEIRMVGRHARVRGGVGIERLV